MILAPGFAPAHTRPVSTEARPTRLADLAAQTPDDRDRFMDLLRAASIVAVVFGHWFIGVIYWQNGLIGTRSAIGLTSWLWMLTWAMQVIPLFFFVGGFSNFTSYARPGGRACPFGRSCGAARCAC